MALPSAQLGSLAGLSMPSSIPAVQVSKEPKLWEKALVSILAQAGGAAAGQGVENLMSREYAPEFGEKGASGFGRLLGPVVGREDATQRRGDARADQRLLANAALQLGSQELAATLGPRDAMEQYNREADRIAQSTNTNQNNLLGLRRENASNDAALARLREDIAARTAQQQTELEALAPGRAAQAESDAALAEQRRLLSEAERLMNEIRRRAVDGNVGGTQPPAVNPNIANFVNRSSVPLPPEQQMVIDKVRQAFDTQNPTPASTSENSLRQSFGTPTFTEDEILQQILSIINR